MVLDEKGGEVSVVLWGGGVTDEAAVLEGDIGLVQEGDFRGTGVGEEGDRDLWGEVGWGEVGWGGCLAVVVGSRGFGGMG